MPKRPPLTHFLCIPLVTSLSKPQLEKAWSVFTTRVAGEARDTDQSNVRIPAKAIRPVGTIHLTLGVMSLDDEKLEAAKSFLRNLAVTPLLRDSSQATKATESLVPDSVAITPNDNLAKEPGAVSDALPDPAIPSLVVSMAGIQPIHSPTSTTILYAAPMGSSSRLFPFCEALRKTFVDSEFLLPDSRPLKLHATIVNTVYVKGRQKRRRGGGHGKDKEEGLKIDATEIIREFENYVWMENVRLDRISICEMGAKKVVVDGNIAEEYREVESIGLP